MSTNDDDIDAEAAAAFLEWSKKITETPGGQSINVASVVNDAAKASAYRQALIGLGVPEKDALAMTVAYIHASRPARIELPPEPPESREGWQG